MESVAYVFLRRWTVSGEWFLQRFFFRNLQQWRNHDFRWPNLNAFFMLHIFIVAKKQQHREKKRKNQTRTENHLRMKIKKKQRERWGREYEKFHFMNVVYRICADSALLVYKPTVLAKSVKKNFVSFFSTHSSQPRLWVCFVSFSFAGVWFVYVYLLARMPALQFCIIASLRWYLCIGWVWVFISTFVFFPSWSKSNTFLYVMWTMGTYALKGGRLERANWPTPGCFFLVSNREW